MNIPQAVAGKIAPPARVRRLGTVPYEPAWRAMQDFTTARNDTTPDEIWLLQHPPVFTQGQAGRAEHLLENDTAIPVVRIDRGGQITYHGPGQLVVYLLVDLRRQEYKIREMVRRMEQSVIDLLAASRVTGERLSGAPGVYVNGAKVAALGLRVKNGCSFHGLCLNVDMDLSPYRAINPCGYAGMVVTQLADLCGERDVAAVGEALACHLARQLNLTLENCDG
ncbi:MAG: lipoyl(octanoyl) transferase LipB [Proteobacteria bacterium]|nr:lipoyl(octanoyl) transferase LipB [Pseudomonadota bacterium]HQR03943.1 lipoyl(octanoyl) transferase LipB [Rhodocyclaceae bacterium]